MSLGCVPTSDCINRLICGNDFVMRSGSRPIFTIACDPARNDPSDAMIGARGAHTRFRVRCSPSFRPG